MTLLFKIQPNSIRKLGIGGGLALYVNKRVCDDGSDIIPFCPHSDTENNGGEFQFVKLLECKGHATFYSESQAFFFTATTFNSSSTIAKDSSVHGSTIDQTDKETVIRLNGKLIIFPLYNIQVLRK